MEYQLVIFELASELLAVEIDAVDGIVKLPVIKAVPHAPIFVEGVTNLRGAVLPVIDLRKRFGLPSQAATNATRIVVIRIGQLKAGMVVDAVTDVLRLPEAAVEPPSPLVTAVDTTFTKGIAKVAGRLIILVELSRVFPLALLAPWSTQPC